jgi:hypothetical protein
MIEADMYRTTILMALFGLFGLLIAAFGIYTQIFSGFDIFFPLDIVLLPLTAIEWFLRYQLTFGSTTTTG